MLRNILFSLIIFWSCSNPPPLIITLGGGANNPTSLDADGGTDLDPAVTASVSPSDFALLGIGIFTVKGGGAATHATPTDAITGTGAWTEVIDIVQGENSRFSLSWVSTGAGTGSGAISVQFNTAPVNIAWIVFEVTNVDINDPVSESSSAQGTSSTITVTMSDVLNGNIVVGVFGSFLDTNGMTAGSGETEFAEHIQGSSNQATLTAVYSTDTSVSVTGANTNANAAGCLEINKKGGIVKLMPSDIRILASRNWNLVSDF